MLKVLVNGSAVFALLPKEYFFLIELVNALSPFPVQATNFFTQKYMITLGSEGDVKEG